MSVEKITAILEEGGFVLANSVKGNIQGVEDAYAIVQVRRHDVAVQINTVSPDVTDRYIKHLEVNGLTVSKAPGTFRTLYVNTGDE